MTVSQKQRIFTKNLGLLIAFAYRRGWELSLREVYRPPEMAKIYAQRKIGVDPSIHGLSLGADLILFIKGVIQHDSLKYVELGKYWEGLHPLNRWGGKFKKVDGGHFSMSHAGLA